MEHHLIAVLLHHAAHTVGNRLHRRGEWVRRGIERQRARLQAAEIQQFVDQTCQALRLVDDHLHVFRRRLAGNIAHHLDVAANHRQRRAQVVADVGNQLVLQVLHLT